MGDGVHTGDRVLIDKGHLRRIDYKGWSSKHSKGKVCEEDKASTSRL